MSGRGVLIQGAILVVVVVCLNILDAQAVAVSFAGLIVAAAVVLYAIRVRALRRRDRERAERERMTASGETPVVTADGQRLVGTSETSAAQMEKSAAGRTSVADAHDDPGEPTAPAPRSPLARARPAPLLAVACICAGAVVPAPIHDSLQHGAHRAAIEIGVALAITFSSVFVSTLVDWFYVAPMLRQGDDAETMLCRSSLAKQWRSVTQVWLFHRLLATLGFVLGLVAAVVLLASRLIELDQVGAAGIAQVGAAGIAALTTVLAGFYLARARHVIAFAVRPAFHVGDKIQLVSDDQQERARTYFVVDVALEGPRLLEVRGDDDEVPDQWNAWREHDRVLDFAEAAKLVWRRRRLVSCHPEHCKRVNAYCPSNQEPPGGPSAASGEAQR